MQDGVAGRSPAPRSAIRCAASPPSLACPALPLLAAAAPARAHAAAAARAGADYVPGRGRRPLRARRRPRRARRRRSAPAGRARRRAPAPRSRVLQGRATARASRATARAAPPPPGRRAARAQPDRAQRRAFVPNDPGVDGVPRRLAALQWNFFGATVGVNAPARGPTCRGAGARRPRRGDRGARHRASPTANRGRFRRSPDFAGTRFVARLRLRRPRPLPRRPQRPRHPRRGHDRRDDEQRRSASPGSPTGRDDHAGARARRARARATPRRSRRGIRYAARHGAESINMSSSSARAVPGNGDPRHPRRAALRARKGTSSWSAPPATRATRGRLPRPRAAT